MPEALLLLLVLPLLAGLWALRRQSTKDPARRSGQRDDATREPDRAASDMTVVGKVAMAGLVAAALVIGVLRVTGGGPGWIVIAALAVGAVCLTTVILSERRRTRSPG
ncbi:hypothetical protein [Cellulomonas sp. URHE0023]|uniref:hypothetical protein n=1 Tax=Cellulomonas sp. URHE0023 TaxID=1380354 RepID=UPI000AE9714B|nr:hypothetical protein [Cellulomonas sp. URHE0023]